MERKQKIAVAFGHNRIVWGQHQGINNAVLKVVRCFFHRQHRHLGRNIGRRTRFNLQFVFHDVDDIEFLVTSLSRIASQRIVWAFHAEILLVIGKGFRLTIQDRRKSFKHTGI